LCVESIEFGEVLKTMGKLQVILFLLLVGLFLAGCALEAPESDETVEAEVDDISEELDDFLGDYNEDSDDLGVEFEDT